MNRQKRVLFIHQQKHVGGGQTYVNELSQELSRQGYTAELVETIIFLGTIKFLLSTKAKIIIWSVYAEYPVLLFILSFLLGKDNYLIIYGIWRLESSHVFWHSESLRLRFRHFRYKVKIWLKQFLSCLFASGIVHLSRYGKSLFYSDPLLGLFSKKDVIIYGGVDKKLFKPISNEKRERLRKELGITRSDVILLMVGRVEKRKNFIDGLRILYGLKKRHPNKNILLYLVVSYGKFNDFIYLNRVFAYLNKLKLGNYVRIVSGVSNKDISYYYQMADVYLMLSKQLETFGLVTLEALSSGCPVFGYKACATPEIVSYQRNSYLFNRGDIRSLADAISRYLSLSEAKKQNIRKKLVKSVSRFTWFNSAQNLLKLTKGRS